MLSPSSWTTDSSCCCSSGETSTSKAPSWIQNREKSQSEAGLS